MKPSVYSFRIVQGGALPALSALAGHSREPVAVELLIRGLCRRAVEAAAQNIEDIPHVGHILLSLAVLESPPSLLRSHGRAAAEYLVSTWLPSRPSVDGFYHIDQGEPLNGGVVETTIPQLLMLVGAYGQCEEQMVQALDAHIPGWRAGIEQAWQREGEPPFFLNSMMYHRDIAAARMEEELKGVQAISPDKAAYYLATMPPFIARAGVAPHVVSLIRNSGVTVEHPVPGVGESVGRYLDMYHSVGGFPWLQPLRQVLLSNNIGSRTDRSASPQLPRI